MNLNHKFLCDFTSVLSPAIENIHYKNQIMLSKHVSQQLTKFELPFVLS